MLSESTRRPGEAVFSRGAAAVGKQRRPALAVLSPAVGGARLPAGAEPGPRVSPDNSRAASLNPLSAALWSVLRTPLHPARPLRERPCAPHPLTALRSRPPRGAAATVAGEGGRRRAGLGGAVW